MAKASCETCPARGEALQRLGMHSDGADYVVALAGNPNTGKSTVFNALTGLRQHTGNWPGKTVTRAEGGFRFRGDSYRIIDLPGTYSLLATSTDEEVARNAILFGRPDVTIVVVDATRLERNLNLALQILQITSRVVLCLNLIDEAERKGIVVDHRRLARDLAIPVVPTAARTKVGIPALLDAVHETATGQIRSRAQSVTISDVAVQAAVDELTVMVENRFHGIPNARWIAIRLLDGDEAVADSIESGELSRLIAEEGREET